MIKGHFEPVLMNESELTEIVRFKDPGHFKNCAAGAYSSQPQKLFSCFGIIHRWNNAKIEFMAVKYSSEDKGIQIKLSGGGSEKNETPTETLLRELSEETLLPIKELETINFKPIAGWKNFNSGDEEPSNYKIFFSAEQPLPPDLDVSGKCSDSEIIEKIWLTPEDASKSFYKNHRDAFVEAVKKLMLKDSKYGFQLMNVAH